jgi:peptidoglycan/xylan/chitin deacetylase (PgdA/CDA1 family)
VLWVLLATMGCTGRVLPAPEAEKPTADSRFIIVTAREGDTFESLARKYLGDSRQGWRIASYNRMDTIEAGRRLLIPKVPIRHGGLQVDGYQTVPILVYLDMAAVPKGKRTVSARGFERHLKYLDETGYATITPDQLNAFLDLRGDLPPRAVMISMDTTRPWAYDIAFPALKRRNMRGTLFFDVDRVGTKGHLTWKQLRDMAAYGISMGLYGHPLRTPAKESLADYLKTYEAGLTRPKSLFRDKLKVACRYYAFAEGGSDDFTVALLKKHDYRAAFTRQRGSNPFFADEFALKRSVIRGEDDLQAFRRALSTFRTMELR